jgi:hypothetical protein
MIGFTLVTLHTAPLTRHFMRGAFQQTPKSRMFFGLSPDFAICRRFTLTLPASIRNILCRWDLRRLEMVARGLDLLLDC